MPPKKSQHSTKQAHKPADPAVSHFTAAPAPSAPSPILASNVAPAPAEPQTILTMPLDQLQANVDKALALWKQIEDLLPGGIVLTDEERERSPGRLRKGESEHMLTVLDVCDAYPAFFESLKDLDEGVDPTRFETDLIRDRLKRADILAPFADALRNKAKQPAAADTVLHLRELARGAVTEAYGIAKKVAGTHREIRSKLAPVINYYRDLALSAAESRKANKKK